jgi:transposase
VVAVLPQRHRMVPMVQTAKQRGRQMGDTMIGVDLAKYVFQLHGATMTGEVNFAKSWHEESFYVSWQGKCLQLSS